jgi:hypothetical protein
VLAESAQSEPESKVEVPADSQEMPSPIVLEIGKMIKAGLERKDAENLAGTKASQEALVEVLGRQLDPDLVLLLPQRQRAVDAAGVPDDAGKARRPWR